MTRAELGCVTASECMGVNVAAWKKFVCAGLARGYAYFVQSGCYGDKECLGFGNARGARFRPHG